jgi:hypothetical protein
MKLKGRFETVSDNQGNCKPYSTALRKITSTALLKHRINYGIAVLVPKEMAAKME